MDKAKLWDRYRKYLYVNQETGLMLDISRMNFPDGYLDAMEPRMQRTFGEMAALEAGAIANPDENRMVGHYWLRSPQFAPNPEITAEIEATLRAIHDFTEQIHAGTTTPPGGRPFSRLLVVGIGGSALGPQFVADALGAHNDRMRPFFLDNTDPDGFDRVLAELAPQLAETLVVVISKSGGTKETRNGMLEVKKAYAAAGLDFPKQAVAVTGRDSELDRLAVAEGWLARFPMWDWVGGRTSVTSAVGLLPAALQGIDIDGLLAGARLCDALTRTPDVRAQPGGAACADVVSCHRRPGREGHGAPALQGPASPLFPVPAAARHGVAREGNGPGRQDGTPRHCGIRQQGRHRPACLCPAAPGGNSQFFRHLHRSAEGPGRAIHGG